MRADLRVLIADDHPMFRLGLVMALTQLGFERVDAVENGQLAIDACKREHYDVVLLDVKMPRVHGLQAAAEILSGRPDNDAPIVIMLSTLDQPAVVRAGEDAGVAAFLGKETAPLRLADVIDSLVVRRGRRSGSGGQTVVPLSERERQVLGLLCRGDSTKEIAARLGISPETVKDHLTRLYGKLNVAERAAAVDAAHRLGWVGLQELGGVERPEVDP